MLKELNYTYLLKSIDDFTGQALLVLSISATKKINPCTALL